MQIVCHRAANNIAVLRDLCLTADHRSRFDLVEGDVMACFDGDEVDGFIMIHPVDLSPRILRTPEGHIADRVETVQSVMGAKGIEVCTLREVVHAVSEYGVLLHLESKVPGTFKLIAESDFEGQRDQWHKHVVAKSFHAPELAFMADEYRRLCQCILIMKMEPTLHMLHLMKGELNLAGIDVDKWMYTPDLQEHCRRTDLSLGLHSINDPDEACKWDELGIGEITTDEPRLMRKAMSAKA